MILNPKSKKSKYFFWNLALGIGCLFYIGCLEFGICDENHFRVLHVIDGDTIQIQGGELVRYIGIDTPELRERKGQEWRYHPEPFGQEAKKFNTQLVQGKWVELHFDVQLRDRYQRLLAYVFVDGMFVNEEMLKQGYARLLTIPPDVKYAQVFKQALEEAKKKKRGMWH